MVDVVLVGEGVAGVGDAAAGGVAAGAVVLTLDDGVPVEPPEPVMPGAPGDGVPGVPALPIVGFERMKEGAAVSDPAAELPGELTHPVTVTVGAATAVPPDFICDCAPTLATTDAARAAAKAICLVMTLPPLE